MLQKLDHLDYEFILLMTTNFHASIKEKLSEALDEGSSIKLLHLNNMQLFYYEESDKKKLRAERHYLRPASEVIPPETV